MVKKTINFNLKLPEQYEIYREKLNADLISIEVKSLG